MKFSFLKFAAIALLFIGCEKTDPVVPGQNSISESEVNPEATDSQITTSTVGAPTQHAYWPTDSISRKDLLFIMIPGTLGTSVNYRYILKTAATSGYYSFGVSYSNLLPIELQIGTNPNSTTIENIFEEYLTGVDVSSQVTVTRANSFENRIIKMILHLDANHPQANWRRFLTPTNTLRWEKISIAGHSQGSDHAMYMSKKRSLFRAGFIAGPGSFKLGGQYPSFFSQPGLTSVDKLYGFCHTNDQTRAWSEVQGAWNVLGLPGAATSVDNSAGYTSHQLISSRTGGNGHLTVVLDPNTPIEGGTPVYSTVWRYMNFP